MGGFPCDRCFHQNVTCQPRLDADADSIERVGLVFSVVKPQVRPCHGGVAWCGAASSRIRTIWCWLDSHQSTHPPTHLHAPYNQQQPFAEVFTQAFVELFDQGLVPRQQALRTL